MTNIFDQLVSETEEPAKALRRFDLRLKEINQEYDGIMSGTLVKLAPKPAPPVKRKVKR